MGLNYYQKYISSPEWRAVRSRIIIRAKGKCERCGRRCHSPQVHHKTYIRLGRDLDSDLIALCASCHQKEHPDKEILPQYPSFVGTNPCKICPCEVAEIFAVQDGGARYLLLICTECGEMERKDLRPRPPRRRKAKNKKQKVKADPFAVTRKRQAAREQAAIARGRAKLGLPPKVG